MSQDNKILQYAILPIEDMALSPLCPVGVPIPRPDSVDLEIARMSPEALDAVTVRCWPGGAAPYEILAGVRIWQAAQKAQLKKVAVRITKLPDHVARDLVVRDFGASTDLITEAEIIDQLVEDGLSVTAAGALRGLSRYEASHRRRLLRLHPSVKDMVRNRELPLAHARSLVTEPAETQLGLAKQVVRERMTAEELRRRIRVARGGEGRGFCENVDSPDDGVVSWSLADRVKGTIGAKVTIESNEAGGELRISYANNDVLAAILARLGVVLGDNDLKMLKD